MQTVFATVRQAINHRALLRTACCLTLAGIFLASIPPGYATTNPAGAEDVAFCRLVESREDPNLIAGAAAKPVFLNADAPRTVRMVYFRPNDRPFRAEVVDSMKKTIQQIQGFFAAEMQRHGYGNRTFRFETDRQGEPLVRDVVGEHADVHYLNGGGAVGEIWRSAGRARIEINVIDLSAQTIPTLGGPAGAVASRTAEGGWVLVPGSFSWTTIAHELGHTFGLEHDFRDDEFIMSYGGGNRRRLSACAAEFLSVHPFLDDSIPEAKGSSLSSFELLSPLGYAADSKSIPIQVRIEDARGLHQVFLFATSGLPHFAAGHREVKACRSFSGERTAFVEFDYDGVIPSDNRSSLADPIVHRMHVWAVDTSGRIGRLYIPMYQLSERHVATLDEPGVTSLAFSPSRPALVSGALNSPVRFWDLRNQQIIARFGRESTAFSVAISPDGATLATEHNGTAKLWDLSTGSNTATINVQPGDYRFRYVAFLPPGGGTLAVLSGNKTVKLWNIATGADYAELEHDSRVTSVSFSPDGARLASGSTDGTLYLWDASTGKRIADWEGHDGWVGAVASSTLYGGTLATKAGWDGLVKLWDVKTLRHVGTIENIRGGSSMAFSPDGVILACASGEVVKLWHVGTRTQVDALAHRGIVDVVVFSPDGNTLASGSPYGVELWDAVEWQPRPRELAVVAGDVQRDIPGARLSDALIVQVRDQYGEPLAGSHVTFSVTEGSGTLAMSDVTTDSSGRAATTLILGGEPGPIKVAAKVRGLDAVHFTATIEATPDFDGDGEVGFADFVLFARAFGGSDLRFDLNANGAVDFADFILFANHFGR